MLRDIRGIPLSTDNPAAVAAYERATTLLSLYEGNPLAPIEEALTADPSFVSGWCFKAAAIVTTTEQPLEPELRAAVEAGEALYRRANDRERGLLAAARACLDGDLAGGLALYGRVALEHPRDLVALQVAHLGDFLLGQSSALRDRIAAALWAWDEHVPGHAQLLGMYAFGLEESGHHARAEELGRRAVELEPRDAWAAHAVAHVLEMQARLGEGIAWLERTGAGWHAENSFAFHNHWHRALYHLDLGQIARVLEIYDRYVRPARSQVVLEMVDAAALLWRLHLGGHDVGARFRELADDFAARGDDESYVFNDVHAMMAFVGAGRDAEATALLARIARRGQTPGRTNAMMTREVGLPVAQALHAFGRGDHAAAVDLLLPVRPIAARFGGSHAQRDVLSLTLVEAALRAGRTQMARGLASERARLKPSNPTSWLYSARALEAAGEAAPAQHARQQAARLTEGLRPRSAA